MHIYLFIIATTFFLADGNLNGFSNTEPKVDTDTLPSTRFPKPVGRINDFYRLFTKEEIASLDSLVRAYEKQTTIQIAVVTLDSSYATGDHFEDYTLALANHWAVGRNEKNNGILIALCPDYRRIRIQNGYGIEAALTDGETKTIIDSIVIPQFKKAMFYKGLFEGIVAITKELDEMK